MARIITNRSSQEDVMAMTILIMKDKKSFDGLSKHEAKLRLNKAGFSPSKIVLTDLYKSCEIKFKNSSASPKSATNGQTSKQVRVLAGIIVRMVERIGDELPQEDADYLSAIRGGKQFDEPDQDNTETSS